MSLYFLVLFLIYFPMAAGGYFALGSYIAGYPLSVAYFSSSLLLSWKISNSAAVVIFDVSELNSITFLTVTMWTSFPVLEMDKILLLTVQV